MTWYLLAVSFHILAACVWIGGMVFLAVVLLPALREPEYRGVALPLIRPPRFGFGGSGGPPCSRWWPCWRASSRRFAPRGWIRWWR